MSHTPEPWRKPHICDATHSCECRSILSERYAGSIAEITVDNGLLISEGGNDAPPREEAAANAARIVDCVNAMAGVDDPVGFMDEVRRVVQFYANPEVYRPHPHGPAFDRRDISDTAAALLSRMGDA